MRSNCVGMSVSIPAFDYHVGPPASTVNDEQGSERAASFFVQLRGGKRFGLRPRLGTGPRVAGRNAFASWPLGASAPATFRPFLLTLIYSSADERNRHRPSWLI